ncbi:type IV secretion system protein VirB7 [Pseudaminobacter sp. 19-2017]|uniref:Type IV secretion system protein VirB7 n=1 Tax=Pseudaminobacter soli (ex Zhang et al. 2022) TaxID=2831468 RepID=A0A942I4R9_9HYPH|nr:type IV secretion system protein VirB7 [Pseudaminobacter soli]MBS3651904.1 type IV secretion system protein VirB7 [Pseudaminobacter soli]
MMGLLAAVSGCATLSYPLPKCDGYAKRPLNRSMWDWDAGKAQGDPQQSSLAGGDGTALAFAEQSAETTVDAVAFAGFDEAGSHTACRAG